jgi:ABC-type multidrug transport system fused ATPase/permease subunit
VTRPSHDRRLGWGILFRPVLAQRATLGIVLVLSLISAGFSLAQPMVIGQIIERVQNSAPLGALPWLLAGCVLLGGLLGGLLQYLIQRVSETAVRSSRHRLIDHLLHLPIAQLERRRTGDLVSRVSNDTTTIRNMLSDGVLESFGGIFTLIGALVAMFLIDPVLLAIAAGVSCVAVALVFAVTQRIERASTELQGAVGHLTASTDRALQSVRTIRAANATEREAARVKAAGDQAWKIGLRLAKTIACVAPVSSLALQVSLLAVLGLGGLRVASGTLGIADLVAFIMFLFLLIMPLGQLFSTISAVGEALGGAVRIADVLRIPREEGHVPPSTTFTGLPPGEPVIEFDHVDFAYEDGSGQEAAQTLKGVSFRIDPGQKVAIVGPSGAGKTTVLSLIARFYDPTSGTVRFGGQDTNRLPRETVREHLAYVEQGAPTISGTIRDNLTIGSQIDETKLRETLRQLDLLDIVDRTPQGLDAEVGENGVLLSGGERQRLSLARALLGKPALLLLDESTSQLDGVNEERVQRLLHRDAADCARVIVAHRLATVVDADRILVLLDGAIVAQGTHPELLESSTTYRRLARHQLLPLSDAG